MSLPNSLENKDLHLLKKNDPKMLEILSIKIAGKTAVALVRDDHLRVTYLDTLSFLKIDETWIIYNKLFHIEK